MCTILKARRSFRGFRNEPRHILTRRSSYSLAAMTTSTLAQLKRAAEDDRDISPPPGKRKPSGSLQRKGPQYFIKALCWWFLEKAVANFFKPVSQKEPEQVTWAIRNNSLLTARYQPLSRSLKSLNDGAKRRIAVFDFVSVSSFVQAQTVVDVGTGFNLNYDEIR